MSVATADGSSLSDGASVAAVDGASVGVAVGASVETGGRLAFATADAIAEGVEPLVHAATAMATR